MSSSQILFCSVATDLVWISDFFLKKANQMVAF